MPLPRQPRSTSRIWLMLVAAVFLQVPIALGLGGVLVLLEPPDLGLGRKAVPLVLVQPPPSPEPEEDEPEELDPELLEGQIVEIAPPEDPTPPEEADYLAEVDSSVVEETRTDRFEINPEVLAPRWSEEQRFEQEDLVDLNIEKESTGATVGVESFDPAKNGTLSSLPANWTLTNKDGLQDPVPAAHSEAFLSGAPQNDLLDEALGSEVALNARELVYAAYINRIRRLVNYYWRQNINNMPSSVRLTKARYRTVVKAVLDRDGALELIEITSSSGEDVVDDCLVRAFRLAGPFPNPPATLVKSDGRVYLPDFDFTYRLGQAQNQYQGVDPRAGVQFPGILKAPR